jgi:hypothetical protein
MLLGMGDAHLPVCYVVCSCLHMYVSYVAFGCDIVALTSQPIFGYELVGWRLLNFHVDNTFQSMFIVPQSKPSKI